jgi:ribosomal protein S27AE
MAIRAYTESRGTGPGGDAGMHEEILKKLEQKLDRRSFLRGSSLVAAAAVGMAVASPLVSFAQEQQKPQNDKKTDKKKDDKDDKKDGDDSSYDKETKIDADGREYRTCPQCGSNMYRQGRTWTCENCGYSYVE